MPAFPWKPFPHDASAFDYSADRLPAAWSELHRGDQEPYPDAEFVAAALARHPKLKGPFDAATTAEALQSAWRAYHRGDFEAAVRQGAALGAIGANVANKAANIYASYLEDDTERKKQILLASAERAEALQAAAPDFANAWYFHAQAIGRYSQEISIAKALTQGLATKIKASLDRALALSPRHAEAHIALGAYHAEIVGKVGGVIASLTYGASKEEAVKHFQKALDLLPASAIARIEMANGLVLLYGKSRIGEAQKLYREAAAAEPADAMQTLDGEHARQSL